MKNLVVFLYFVFLFKLAFAQSLPSLPGLESDNLDENPSLIPEYAEVPSLEDNTPPPALDVPSLDADPLLSERQMAPEIPGDNNFGGGWMDAPPAPNAPNTYEQPPAVAAPGLEIDQFKHHSLEESKKDQFSQELEVDDNNYENVSIDNLLNNELEIDVSKDQFPVTPSLGGIQIDERAGNDENKVSFEPENIDQKESDVIEALFKEVPQEAVEQDKPKEEEVVIEDNGVDMLNDFENKVAVRATHTPVTYSEDQLVEHLVKASMTGNKSAVLALLHSGRNANARNKFGETPLMAAVYNGHNAITEILLSEGADANAYDNKGNTALHVAASKKNYFAVEKLIKFGAFPDPRNRSNDTPLLIATLNNSLDVVDLLIRNGADVNKSNGDGLTSLHVATFNNNIEIVKYLLYVGANANMINRDGLKPYDLAYGRNLEIARLLAGYTGRQKFVSNDLPTLIQRQNNLGAQNLQPSNYSQQFNLFPQSYVDEQEDQQLRERQTAWWGARQLANQSVTSVENNNPYSQPEPVTPFPPQEYAYQQPQQYSTPTPQSMTSQQAPAIAESNYSEPLSYENISQDRANKAEMSNVASITNNYAPTKKPENIISQNIDFMGSKQKPKSEVYNGDLRYAGLPTPKSMNDAPSPYNDLKPTAKPAAAPQQQIASPSKQIVRYQDLPMEKKMSWDRNLEKWLRASGRISEFSPQEKQVWEKQRAILQSVYQNDFKNSVEKTKRKIIAQQSSSLDKYGVKVTPTKTRSSSGLTREQVGRALTTSYLRRNPSAI